MKFDKKYGKTMEDMVVVRASPKVYTPTDKDVVKPKKKKDVTARLLLVILHLN